MHFLTAAVKTEHRKQVLMIFLFYLIVSLDLNIHLEVLTGSSRQNELLYDPKSQVCVPRGKTDTIKHFKSKQEFYALNSLRIEENHRLTMIKLSLLPNT